MMGECWGRSPSTLGSGSGDVTAGGGEVCISGDDATPCVELAPQVDELHHTLGCTLSGRVDHRDDATVVTDGVVTVVRLTVLIADIVIERLLTQLTGDIHPGHQHRLTGQVQITLHDAVLLGELRHGDVDVVTHG